MCPRGGSLKAIPELFRKPPAGSHPMPRPREPCAPHLLERGIRALVISDVSLSCLLMSSHMNICPSETLWLSKRACPRGGLGNLPGTPQGTPRNGPPGRPRPQQMHVHSPSTTVPCSSTPMCSPPQCHPGMPQPTEQYAALLVAQFSEGP